MEPERDALAASRRDVVLNGKFLAEHWSGAQRAAYELILALDRLLSEGRDQGRWSLATPPGARPVLGLKTVRAIPIGPLRGQAWEQITLPLWARGALLVNLGGFAPLGAPGAITLLHDAQVFLTPKSYSWPYRTWTRFCLPRIAERAGVIITSSEFSRTALQRTRVCRHDRMEVVSLGGEHLLRPRPDYSTLERLGLKAGGYVVAISSLIAHKNMQVLFKALRHASPPPLDLVLVGGGGPAAFQARGFEPPTCARFAGNLTDSQLRGLLENAACLAYPSTTEGFGLPPLEAMSLGCPVVAAPCGAIPEVCGDAVLYADPFDPEAWARAFERVLDAPRRTALIEAGHQRRRLFTWDRAAAQIAGLIDAFR